MRVLFIEHDHVSPAGSVGAAFQRRGYDIEELVVVPAERFSSPAVEFVFPEATHYDAIVPMGAAWSTYDTATVGTWVIPELELLRAAEAAGVPVLGICFGGQLLATAHGGSVKRSPAPELGWHVVHSDRPDVLGTGPWFQWHFDRWIVPPGAVEIARNAAASQAFVYVRRFACRSVPPGARHADARGLARKRRHERHRGSWPRRRGPDCAHQIGRGGRNRAHERPRRSVS
jgi:GMP synthase-like glutamine amidotransferase